MDRRKVVGGVIVEDCLTIRLSRTSEEAMKKPRPPVAVVVHGERR